MKLLLLTDSHVDVLPALDLLPYTVQVSPRADWTAAAKDLHVAVVLVDASEQLNEARATCHAIYASRFNVPLIGLVREAGLAAMTVAWRIDDFILTTAGPAEVAARLSIVVERHWAEPVVEDELIQAGDLTVEPYTYTATLRGEPLALTYKEFELLRYLAQHPDRAFSRDQLLREIWATAT